MQCYPFIHSDDQTAEPVENLQLVRASDCASQSVEWLWPGKIAIGKVTLLIGDPGTGKSLLALDIAARVSRAAPWPEQDGERGRQGEGETLSSLSPSAFHSPSPPLPLSPSSVLILSATDDLADTIRPRLDAAGADPRRVFAVPSIADLRDDFAQLRAAVNCAPNCRLIIIDPINAYVGPSDSHFQTVVRKVLAPLAQLAAEKRIAVLAVAHLRKNDGAAIYRAAGSMGFVAAARAVWTVCRDKDNPGRQLFLPLKNNLGPAACGLAYSIEPRGQNGAAAISWHSAPITTSAEEALRSPEATDLHAARQWLRQTLAHGPRSASEVTQEASHHGFHERTLRRALHAIGGHTQNRGLLEGWWWSIPDAPTDDRGLAHFAEGTIAAMVAEQNVPGTIAAMVPLPRAAEPGPEKSVPLCPLPQIFNDPPECCGRSPTEPLHSTEGLKQSPKPYGPASELNSRSEDPWSSGFNESPGDLRSTRVPGPETRAQPYEPPGVSESIAALDRLDRQRRNDRRGNTKPKSERLTPSTGNPVLDEMLDSLRQSLPTNPHNSQQTVPDTS